MKLSVYAYGGGYAVAGLTYYHIVEKMRWISDAEFLRLVAIAQMTPGPLGVNVATFTGFKLHGVLGAMIATLSVVIIPVALGIVASRYFFAWGNNPKFKSMIKGFGIAAILIIAQFLYSLVLTKNFDAKYIAPFVIYLFLLMRYRVSPFLIIIAGGAVGLIAR
jgi:chromate transporter